MLSRRVFLNGALGAGAALAVPHKAAAQADRRMIVDAQIHLWKAESDDWKWVPGATPQLPVPFTIERAISMMDEAGVDRAVDRAAVLAWRPQRLCARGGEALSHPLPRHGQARAQRSQGRRAAAEMEGAAGHGRPARDLQHAAVDSLAHRRDGGLVLGGGREGRTSGDVLCARPHARRSARSRSVSRGCN